MTTAALRKKLINFIADADDKKIKGMYLLLEEEIEKEEEFTLSDVHIAILDQEHENHITGKSKSYSWSEASTIIRVKKRSQMYTLILKPRAVEMATDAYAWYENQYAGLG